MSNTVFRKPPAAGIIPYTKINNELKFLLGYENQRKNWSGFVGGYEPDDKFIVNTAIREFNEETSMICGSNLVYVRNQINKKSLFIKTSTRCRNVYIWFVEFPSHVFDNIEDIFRMSRLNMVDNHYKEKSKIKLMGLDEINQSIVLQNLKDIINGIHYKL